METPKKSHRVRLATTEDAKSIIEIYSPYILHTSATFETEIPSIDEIKSRIKKTLIDLPWLIYEDNDGIVQGYAYANKYRNRPAYEWTAESAVYTSKDYQGKGIGQQLYSELFRILLKQGYYKLLALTAGDNEKSLKFHIKMGFKPIGQGSSIGNKFGKWVDVNWFEKDLQAFKDNPTPTVPYQLCNLCV